MKKHAVKKLQISRETLGSLKSSELTRALGGTMAGDVDKAALALTSNYSYEKPCCVCV